jgi:phosphoribosyl 1,2-cyclic phosphate phosphodiesterase
LIRYWGPGAAGEPTQAIIDTSPDLRNQLLAANVTRLDAVLLSHEHADQCHGIDDVRALVIRQRRRMPVYMDRDTSPIIRTRFEYCFRDHGGYPAILEERPMEAGQAVRIEGPGGDLEVLPLAQDHGFGPSLGFRVGGLGYCNDVVRLPDETLEQLAGVDTLVVDALRYTPHPSHANVEQALAWIALLKPRRAILTNLHGDLDYAKLRAELPAGVEPAFDGLELEIAQNA